MLLHNVSAVLTLALLLEKYVYLELTYRAMLASSGWTHTYVCFHHLESPLAPSDIAMDPEQAEDPEYPEDTSEPPTPPRVTPKRSRKKPATLEDQLKCSRCCEDIQRHTALFRCLECADAALCWRCMPEAHKKHCVMRLPSARVYVSAS